MAQRPFSAWFVRRGLAEGSRPLYVVPHAGAGAASVHALLGALSGPFDAHAVRLPGRESRVRDPFLLDLDLLTAELAREVVRHAGGDSPVLYGHCGGATIAWETARRLQAEHGLDVGLAVSSHPAPGITPREPSWTLPREAFLAQVRADGYLPDGLVAHDEIMAIYEPILRADYQLIEKHELGMAPWDATSPVVQGGALALYGSTDTTLTREQVQAWERLCSEGVDVVELDAGHDLPQEAPDPVAATLVRTFGPRAAA